MPDVMADDAMVNSTGNYNRFVSPYQYSITPSSTYSVDPWIGCYSLIDNCNAILDNLETYRKVVNVIVLKESLWHCVPMHITI